MSAKRLELQWLDPATLQPNPWNTNIVSPQNEEKLEKSIERLGQFKPIIVRTLENGTLQILGGEHRARIAQRKGLLVPVLNLGRIDDRKAKEISIADNGRYGADDALKLNELLASLGPLEDLASFLPYTDAELEMLAASSSIALDELDIPEDSEEPKLPSVRPAPTHQIMRFKVPVDDAATITELIEWLIKKEGLTDSDSLTNAGDALVILCRKFKELYK